MAGGFMFQFPINVLYDNHIRQTDRRTDYSFVTLGWFRHFVAKRLNVGLWPANFPVLRSTCS